MKKLLLLIALASLSTACQVSLNGVLHDCAVWVDDHLVHCVPILPTGNFPKAPSR